MKVFIPNDIIFNVSDKELFILVRPFRVDGKWINDLDTLDKWGLRTKAIEYTNSINEANVIILPYPVSTYFIKGMGAKLAIYNKLAAKYGIKVYAFLSGDWGRAYLEFDKLIYFRTGGFRRQLSERNQGFPVSLSDHRFAIYGSVKIEIREKQTIPVVGFCGHASKNILKLVRECANFAFENLKRTTLNPLQRNWEPLFPSAYHRSKLMQQLEECEGISTNFIYRNHYRAGAITKQDRTKTTREYYDNIQNSDYVLCVRGGGNFSVRLYETLMMGRIPVFVNTDCLLPFPDFIDWRKHVVWVEWGDRHQLAERVLDFHKGLTDDEFKELQYNNRSLWLNELSVAGIYKFLDPDLKRLS